MIVVTVLLSYQSFTVPHLEIKLYLKYVYTGKNTVYMQFSPIHGFRGQRSWIVFLTDGGMGGGQGVLLLLKKKKLGMPRWLSW